MSYFRLYSASDGIISLFPRYYKVHALKMTSTFVLIGLDWVCIGKHASAWVSYRETCLLAVCMRRDRSPTASQESRWSGKLRSVVSIKSTQGCHSWTNDLFNPCLPSVYPHRESLLKAFLRVSVYLHTASLFKLPIYALSFNDYENMV